MISVLTSQPIYGPLNQTANEDKSEKSDFDINFTIEFSIAKKN